LFGADEGTCSAIKDCYHACQENARFTRILNLAVQPAVQVPFLFIKKQLPTLKRVRSCLVRMKGLAPQSKIAITPVRKMLDSLAF